MASADQALITQLRSPMRRDEVRFGCSTDATRVLILESTTNGRIPAPASSGNRLLLVRPNSAESEFQAGTLNAGYFSGGKTRGRGIGRAAKRAPSQLSFHSLRHTAVSLLKDAGIPQAVVQELIGHDSEQMSAQYTHVGREALERAAAALPEI